MRVLWAQQEHAVRAAAEGAEALPPTPTGEKDKRGGFKDNGQMEGAISGEIAMEKVGAALVPSLPRPC